MAKNPDDLIKMTDEELVFYALSGDVDSYAHRIGETAMVLRNSLRNLEATKEMAKSTQDLASSTRNYAIATWAIALITLATQVCLIILTLKK